MYAGRSMADAQHTALLPAAEHRIVSETAVSRGGTALSGIICPGGSGSQERPDRTQPEIGGAHYEEVLIPLLHVSGTALVGAFCVGHQFTELTAIRLGVLLPIKTLELLPFWKLLGSITTKFDSKHLSRLAACNFSPPEVTSHIFYGDKML